jgi:2-polyprenyl-3-methyl-5-hydroxy-6-metoxy-1,4-benzoquinol methylase
MSIIKTFLIFCVRVFFSVYFTVFGKPSINARMKRTLKLYATGDFAEDFQLIRLWDAPLSQLEKYFPRSGVVVDLGSGDGLLANYIAISNPKVRVYGIDINRDRVKEAQKGVRNTTFVTGDILDSKIPKADTIFLVHVLHHLPSKASQLKLLKDIRTKLKPKGKLIIVEINNAPIFKYIFTWLIDTIAVPILFEGGIFNSKIFYRKALEWEKVLSKLKFQTNMTHAHQSMPFSHIILECSMN